MKYQTEYSKNCTSVYIVAQTTGLDLTAFRKENIKGIFKIGISGDPEKRMRALNSGPTHVDLISEYEFKNREEAKYAEALLHKILYAYNHKHEWFSLNQNRLKIIDKVLVSLLGGSCHYYEKEYFVTPPMTGREILKASRVSMFDYNDRKPFTPKK